MRTFAFGVVVMAATVMTGCKSESGGAAADTSAKASGASTSTSTGAAAKAAPTPPPAKKEEKAPFTQKGIPAGKVVVGYLQDNSDPAQCAVVVDAPAKKDSYAKDAEKVAQMMKAKVVTSCPTDNVVGTCNAGLGMLVNFSGPKWTTETAKKDCLSKPHQKWVD